MLDHVVLFFLVCCSCARFLVKIRLFSVNLCLNRTHSVRLWIPLRIASFSNTAYACDGGELACVFAIVTVRGCGVDDLKKHRFFSAVCAWNRIAAAPKVS
jgi:hypothetical protein